MDDPRGSTPALSIVIPAFNESERIGRTLARATAFLQERDESWEIVVGDDGSGDETAQVVEAFSADGHPEVRLVRLARNRGKGAALRASVAASRGARVLMMDADLATPIQELALLEAALLAGNKIASGSRGVPSSNVRRRQSLLRTSLGGAGNLWIRALCVPGMNDTQCGFKLFDGETARALFAACVEDGFAIDIEVLCIAKRWGLPVAEVGVAWEHQEGSKVQWRDYVRVFLSVPRIAWTVSRTERK
jgi:glycosyltransferase involved in cell wall biosynthesis